MSTIYVWYKNPTLPNTLPPYRMLNINLPIWFDAQSSLPRLQYFTGSNATFIVLFYVFECVYSNNENMDPTPP